jgi:hypothetical protein
VFGEPISDGIEPAGVLAHCSRDGAPIRYGERHMRPVARAVDAPVDARGRHSALTHADATPDLAS